MVLLVGPDFLHETFLTLKFKDNFIVLTNHLVCICLGN